LPTTTTGTDKCWVDKMPVLKSQRRMPTTERYNKERGIKQKLKTLSRDHQSG